MSGSPRPHILLLFSLPSSFPALHLDTQTPHGRLCNRHISSVTSRLLVWLPSHLSDPPLCKSQTSQFLPCLLSLVILACLSTAVTVFNCVATVGWGGGGWGDLPDAIFIKMVLKMKCLNATNFKMTEQSMIFFFLFFFCDPVRQNDGQREHNLWTGAMMSQLNSRHPFN